MKNLIISFNKQFSYEPFIENKEKIKNKYLKFVIGGMGGSNLTAELLKIREPNLEIISHKDYGLPIIKREEINNYLFIANSYSGNTEETIDFLRQTLKYKLASLVISSGGKLIEIAKKYQLPYIKMPADVPPRLALGYNIKALAKAINKENLLKELTLLKLKLKPIKLKRRGKNLAQKILKSKSIPIIYSSSKNFGIAYNWKIKFNETGKIPAFCNFFPELNHNEIEAFNIRNKSIAKKFYFIILRDENDNYLIKKRMKILTKLYKNLNLKVEIINLKGKFTFYKIFNSLILADWISYYLAILSHKNPISVELIERFKKLMTNDSPFPLS